MPFYSLSCSKCSVPVPGRSQPTPLTLGHAASVGFRVCVWHTRCSRLSLHVSCPRLRIGPFSRSPVPSVEERRGPGRRACGCRVAVVPQATERGAACACGRPASTHRPTHASVRGRRICSSTPEFPLESPALIRHHVGHSRLLSWLVSRPHSSVTPAPSVTIH